MRSKSLLAVAEIVIVLCIGGCANDTVAPSASTDSAIADDSGSHSEMGGVCTSHCTTDYNCSSTCASPPTGSYNCCDTATGVCYVHAGFCPTAAADTGVDTAPY